MTHLNSSQRSVQRLWLVAALAASCLTAYVSRGPFIPFWVTSEVTAVLAGWLHAGMWCERPELGMPGPTADWDCRRSFAGVEVGARLTADRNGVMSVVVGVPAGTPGEVAARAFAELLAVTSMFKSARADVRAWLLAGDAADGVMPAPSAAGFGRASVARDDHGHTLLYLTPIGSTILRTD